LIQYVTGHEDTTHKIATSSSRNYDVESNHHQLIYPFNINSDRYKLLAWTKYFRSELYLNGNNNNIDLHRDFLEVEMIQFDNELCIQPHVETSANVEFRSYCLRLIKSIVDNKTKSKSYDDNFEPYDERYDYGWDITPKTNFTIKSNPYILTSNRSKGNPLNTSSSYSDSFKSHISQSINRDEEYFKTISESIGIKSKK